MQTMGNQHTHSSRRHTPRHRTGAGAGAGAPRATERLDVVGVRESRIDSPLGSMCVFQREGSVVALEFEGRRRVCVDRLERRFGRIQIEAVTPAPALARSFADYFGGNVAALDAVPVDVAGGPFERRVWRALRGIPAGRPMSYGALAKKLGRPTAARAVGRAAGANPVAVIIPCHRVVGASGSLTGYAGGLERKRRLLDHEAAHGMDRHERWTAKPRA